jgi:hypothetical protein
MCLKRWQLNELGNDAYDPRKFLGSQDAEEVMYSRSRISIDLVSIFILV